CTRVWRGRSVARARTRRRCFFWGLTVVVLRGLLGSHGFRVARERCRGAQLPQSRSESPKSSKLLNWTGRVRVSTSSKFPFAPEKPTKLARGVNCEGGGRFPIGRDVGLVPEAVAVGGNGQLSQECLGRRDGFERDEENRMRITKQRGSVAAVAHFCASRETVAERRHSLVEK
ncbi:unnamed protein product, partial [Ixodes pacificus]